MIGIKIYYEKTTGYVVLTIPEKHHGNATPTTTEQDFAMYDVLALRNMEEVEVLQLPYGKYRGDFQLANSWKIDLETGQILFEYPTFETPITEQVKHLLSENNELKVENEALRKSQADQDEIIMQLMLGGN